MSSAVLIVIIVVIIVVVYLAGTYQPSLPLRLSGRLLTLPQLRAALGAEAETTMATRSEASPRSILMPSSPLPSELRTFTVGWLEQARRHHSRPAPSLGACLQRRNAFTLRLVYLAGRDTRTTCRGTAARRGEWLSSCIK